MSKFEDLLFCNQLSVERFVKFRIPNISDAEDILQEVYFTAFKNFEQLKTEASFKAWLIGIARHKCNDYFRNKSKDLEIPIEELNEFQLSQTRFGYVENNTVNDILDALGDKDKQILYLSYWKQLPQIEIAARLGIPIGTVKSRLYTAKNNFKRIYPTNTYIGKVDYIMKKLPEKLPEYKIEKSVETPFSVKWEELWGLFIVPKVSEKCIWGIYETKTKKCSEWGEMEVIGKATVHNIEGVEIKEYRHNHFGGGKDDADHYYIAQLTDDHCRVLAENYIKNGVRKYLTFLDGDDFISEWGYGEDNCGKETNLTAKGKISEYDGKIIAENTNQLFDIVGRYFVTINGKKYDTVRVLSLDSYYGEYVCCEQYLDTNGRTILWRRFNRDDWAIKRYKHKWSEQLPNNEQLIINGETYVHWYDCITDYIF